MRKLVFLAALISTTIPAMAAKPVTVEQLHKLLDARRTANKQDDEIAKELSSLQLTEQLTAVTLSQLTKEMLPGPKTAEALDLLVDSSGFLPPPASEALTLPKLDIAAQRAMMNSVIQFVTRTLRHLPDFLATRVTRSFDDSPIVVGHSGFAPHANLHLAGVFNRGITYRNGWEVLDSPASGVKRQPASGPAGLSTWGEFGPVLATILTDIPKGTLSWNRWERTTNGVASVFHFAIPKDAAHYIVDYCCVWKFLNASIPKSHDQADTNLDLTNKPISYHGTPAYHGDLYVDPVTGAILRVTLEAELNDSDVITRAAIIVQYDRVDIGGSSFICPVRSVAISTDQNRPGATPGETQVTRINEVSFIDYHRFGSTTRILTNDLESSIPSTSAHSPIPVPETEIDASITAQTIPAAVAEVQKTDSTYTGAVSVSKNEEPPSPPATLVIRTTARLVDVGIVAYDKKGHPVVDLKPGDIEIFDNDRKQLLKSFSAFGRRQETDLTPDNSKAELNPDQTHRRDGLVAAAEAADANKAEGTTTVLLIDSKDLAWDDLSYARQEVQRFLGHLSENDSVGIYIMKETGLQILTEPSADHTHVAEVFRKWLPGAQELARAQEEERRIRQQFDTVRHPSDLVQVNGNAAFAQELYAPLEGTTQNTVDVASPMPIDLQLRSFAGNPERTALSILVIAARHLVTIPGHKNLVWIASDNVLADWNNRPANTDKGSKALDPFAMKVQETLNDAHVSIYPLDASQLEAGSIGADLRNRNVEAVGYSARSQMAADQGNGLNPGRITAQLQEDVHPIQGIFREVSEATGGRTLRRSSDLAAELNGVVADGHAAYILSFTPDTPPDGTYHELRVKLTLRKDIALRYRTTYLYDR